MLVVIIHDDVIRALTSTNTRTRLADVIEHRPRQTRTRVYSMSNLFTQDTLTFQSILSNQKNSSYVINDFISLHTGHVL
jgi:hypothetical protein